MARSSLPQIVKENIRIIDIILGIELLLIAIVQGHTFIFFPAFTTIIRISSLLIPLAFIPIALSRRLHAALATIAILGILLSYQLWFSALWGTALGAGTLGSFQALLLPAMIAVHAKSTNPTRFFTIFYIACLIYLMMFFYYYFTLDAGAISYAMKEGDVDTLGGGIIRRTHDAAAGLTGEDQFKIPSPGAIMSYLVIFSLVLFTSESKVIRKWIALFLLLLTSYGIFLADSRFNAAVTILACVSIFIKLDTKVKVRIYYILSILAVIVYEICAFSSINLFSLLASDASGAARFDEFNAANPVFLQTPIFGIGLWSVGTDWDVVFRHGAVAPSDLGYYGELLQHGLIGMGLLLLSLWFFVRLADKLIQSHAGRLPIRLLSAYLLYLVCVQFVTTQLLEGAGGIMLSMAIAYLPLQKTQQSQTRSKRIQR